MGKIGFYKTAILYCLVLAGCAAGNSVLHIQTYPNRVPDNNIGCFDISFRRFHFNRFWGTINYDLKKDVILYKDSVKIYYKGEMQDVILFKDNDDTHNPEMNQMTLSGKNCLNLRFYPSDPILRGVFYTKVMQGDTVMLHTKNALYTSSGVIPLDSVRFIQGERYKFKDNFVKRKGKTEYGFYKIAL